MTHYENYKRIIEMIDDDHFYKKSVEERNGAYLVTIGGYIAMLCDIMEELKK